MKPREDHTSPLLVPDSDIACFGAQQVSLHVVTNDRLLSLKRLVDSLKASHYLGDEVQLAIHVDTAGNEELMDYVMVSYALRIM